MSDTLEFKTWLVKPGNHRIFQQVKRHLIQLFSRDVEVKSWLDIYHWFELSLGHTEDAIKWFAPILHDNPPSPATGATPKQILLYRGAYVNKDAENAPASSNPTQVTYRGQKMQSSNLADEIKTGKKPQYYRGARIDTDSEN